MPLLTPPADCPAADSAVGFCYGTCSAPVMEDPRGGFFITQGHPGFNSPTNNALGYGSRARALAALRTYAGQGRAGLCRYWSRCGYPAQWGVWVGALARRVPTCDRCRRKLEAISGADLAEETSCTLLR